jgi:hypothetical protein
MRNTPFIINFTNSCVYCPERNHFTLKPGCHAEWRHIRWRYGSGSLWRHTFFPVATLYQRKVRRSHVKKIQSPYKRNIGTIWTVSKSFEKCLSKIQRKYEKKELLQKYAPTYCGKHKCKNTKGMSWAVTLPILQNVTTEQLHHYVPHRHGLFQVCNCKYPSLWTKPTDPLRSKCIWYHNSTCFGQLPCPSSGVLHCTSALVHYSSLTTACYQGQDVPSCPW